MHRFIPFLLYAVLLLALPAWAKHRETGFLNRSVVVNGTSYRYQVYVPATWTSDRRWPVILFLHGAGERGDDGLAQTEIGIGRAIRLHSDRFPAIVVMPQCPKDNWWEDAAMEAQALAALNQACKEFRGDADRIYLTGLSMGGYGSWSLAAKYPGKWAAAVVICGGVVVPKVPGAPEKPITPGVDPYADAAKKIGSTLPVWVFHGAADPAVPVEESRNMVAALKAIGSDVKYTEYEGVQHNSWDKAYSEPELPIWLFAQRLSARKDATR